MLRLEYITYHFAILRLDGISNYCKQKPDAVNDTKLTAMLDSIDFSDIKGLRKTDFRNCMMHFGLKSKEGTPYIDANSIDLAKPFCGLVESQFGKSYEDYQTLIEAELTEMYNRISNYLDFDLALSE